MASSQLVIRPMTSADVNSLRDIHAQLLPLVSYPNSFFLQLLIMPGRHCLVAVDRENPAGPIGFVSALVHNAPNTAYHAEREELDYLVDSYLSSRTPLPKRKGGSGIFSSSNAEPPREPRLELLTLGVVPRFQNAGLARRLVQEMVRRVRQSLTKGPSDLAIDTNVSVTGLPPPSPQSPVTPTTPENARSRATYFEDTLGAEFDRCFSSTTKNPLVIYANVATTNIPAISFYEKLGMSVIPGARLQGLYKGQGSASRLLSNASFHNTGMGDGRDAFVVAGLL